jgi:hypothetical protein
MKRTVVLKLTVEVEDEKALNEIVHVLGDVSEIEEALRTYGYLKLDESLVSASASIETICQW